MRRFSTRMSREHGPMSARGAKGLQPSFGPMCSSLGRCSWRTKYLRGHVACAPFGFSGRANCRNSDDYMATTRHAPDARDAPPLLAAAIERAHAAVIGVARTVR